MGIRNYLILFLSIFALASCAGIEAYGFRKHGNALAQLNTNNAIVERKDTGEGVSLIVHMPLDSINNFCAGLTPAALDSWKRMMENQVVGGLIFSFVEQFKPVRVIDRNQLATILEELKLSQSGLMNPRARLKVGELLGANYMFIVSLNRTCSGSEIYDRYTRNLVAVESGQIVASDILTFTMMYSYKTQQLEIIKTHFNNAEVIYDKANNSFYLPE